MSAIVPAILPTSRQDLEEKLGRLVGIASEVQIDAVDGIFASPATWPYTPGTHEAFENEYAFPHLDEFHIEADLMVDHPEHAVGEWIAAGATRILVHLESALHLPQFISDLKTTYGHEKGFAPNFLSFGIAVNTATELSALEPYINDIDYVQFMGIRSIGRQGEPFAPEVLERIARFRKSHPDMCIQVDGGVNFESAPLLLAAGVSRLVVGSALWRAPDVGLAYGKLVELTQTHGLYE